MSPKKQTKLKRKKRETHGLRRQLILFFVGVPMVLIAAFVVVIDRQQRQQAINRAVDELDQELTIAKTVLETRPNQLLTFLKQAATLDVIVSNVGGLIDSRGDNDDGAQVTIRNYLDSNAQALKTSILLVVDANGRVLVRAAGDKAGDQLLVNGFLERVMATGIAAKSLEIWPAEELANESINLDDEVVVQRQPTPGSKQAWRPIPEERDALAQVIVVPITQDDTVIGAFVSSILLNRNNEVPDRTEELTNHGTSIFLHDAIIATNLVDADDQRLIGRLAPEAVVDAVNINGDDFVEREFIDGLAYQVAYRPLKNSKGAVIGSLAQAVAETEVLAPVRSLYFWYVVLAVAGAIVVSFIAQLLARNLARPLKRLVEATKEISRGHLDVDVPEPDRSDEIGDLANSIVVMKNKLDASYSKLEDTVASRTGELKEKVQDLERTKRTMMNVMEDLEESKRSIESEKTKSESILTSVGEGVMAIDRDRKIILFNKRAGELLGFAAKDVVGKKLETVLTFKYSGQSPLSIKETPMIQAMTSGKPVTVPTSAELNMVTKSGRELAINSTAAPLIDLNGQVIGGVSVFQDVTKEREVDRMKSEFVSVASHQLRTPLSASKWFLELLLTDDKSNLTDEQAEFIRNVAESNERMISLVNDLLNVSRLESGSIGVTPEPTDLGELINDILTEIKPGISERKQKLVIEAPSPALPKIKIDPKLVRQVIENMLANANKYTPEKGTVTIRWAKRDQDVLIEVIDTGVGIPAGQQHRVFNKFFRADNVIQMQTEGTGLGLYVAREIVTASGGRIWFTSEEGKGTTFSFTLPLAGSKPRAGDKTLVK